GPGSEFTDNLAQTHGGAIYLKSGKIMLNASAAGNILFRGNKHGVTFTLTGDSYVANAGSGTPNAVYLGTSGTFIVDTADDSKVEFYDPIHSGGAVTFEKTGTGSVYFYDYGSLTGMISGSPTTNVKGGFFIVKLSENPPVGAVAAYGTVDRGTITVSGTSATQLGVIVGESSAKIQAETINVDAYGEIWADDPVGTVVIKANAFNLKNNGGLGGHGTLRVEDSNSMTIAIATTGTFTINAIDHGNPTDPNVTFTLEGSLLQGIGKLKKTGPGKFEMDRAHVYSGGTQVEEGTLLITYPGDPRQTQASIGAGSITVNENGTLYVKPTGSGNYSINNTLNAHNSGAKGGLLRVDLGNTSNILTIANSTNYDGRLLLENLTYTMANSGITQVINARVEAGAGSLLHVNSGASPTEGFKFASGVVRFNDLTAGATQMGSRITTSALDVSGTGTVQVNSSLLTASHGLFTNNDTPLLQRDNYGMARQFIGAKNSTITVTGNAANIQLTDFNGTAVDITQQVNLMQNSQDVAIQYVRLNSESLTTGPQNDGLYIGAVLFKISLNSGKTTSLSGDVTTVAGGNDFSAQIVGEGNLQIDATNSIILNNASPAPNSFSGTTTVNTGRLVGGADNIIASSSGLEVKAGATFDTGNFNQGVKNLTGAGTLEVNAGAGKTLTITQASPTTFSGALVGSGVILKDGVGTLTLSGTANTHSGNWNVNGGGLIVTGTIGSSGNYAGNIGVENASVVFNQTGNQTLAGNITRNHTSATVQKLGAGTLSVNGRIEPQFTLSAGVLAGVGTLYNAVFATGAKISPGTSGGADMGVLSFGENTGSTTIFSGVHILLNLKGASQSDTINVTGDVAFANNNTLDFQWDDAVFKDGSYTIVKASGGLYAGDGVTPLTTALMQGTTFLQGGAAIANARNLSELRIVSDGEGNKIVLTTWANKNYTVYWDGKPAPSDNWNDTSTNKNWWTTEVTGTKQSVPFLDGDIAMFNNEAPAKTVIVDTGGVTVYAMTVTGAAYTFNGGKITGDPNSWNSSYSGEPPPTISSRLLVESNATALFDGAVEFPEIEVQGAAEFNAAVKVNGVGKALKATGSGYIKLGNSGSFTDVASIILDGAQTKLEFNRTSTNYTYAGVISGSGSVEKTGNAEVTLTGDQTYTGETKISAGKLTVTGRLGAGNYNGGIIDNGTLEFNQTQAQTLNGRIDGSGALIKSGNEKLTLTHAESRYTGSITVNAGIMEVSGRVGAIYETFDGGTAFEATYVSGYYTGNIHVAENAKLTFSFAGDYQVLAGGLSGGGTLEKKSAMPMYFVGNASSFSGYTVVQAGGFHLAPGTLYGSTTASGGFTVASGAALHVNDGGKIIAETMSLLGGASLVSHPGQFTIQAKNSANITISANAALFFYLGENDVDTAAAPKPKIAFQDASGGAAQVDLPNPIGLKVLPGGYVPRPELDGHFTLLSGLDINSIATRHGSYDAALLAIFGTKEIEIMSSWFDLFFTATGELMLHQRDFKTTIPEPATYGLFSGILLGSLALLRRRKSRKGRSGQNGDTCLPICP
ncbi:MAG: autotransporter-associated beta strand repeat-containing protein, partial [Puniceicoccales bacterium]|nr:autotransporter-associated beta strand repeat-containing protein [Puniceicoccales bacterium]